MARGDGGKPVFEDDKDRYGWMDLMDRTCERFVWRVHAWVLMGNHFHLLVETPEPNLVAGMKWMLGVYSQGWNRRRQSKGHVFQGRYKAVVVNGEEREGCYFKIVADYIHLNAPTKAWQLFGKGKWVDETSVVAALIRKRTGVRNRWVAERLGMGHEGNVTRAIRRVNEYPSWKSRFANLEAMLVSRDPFGLMTSATSTATRKS